MLSFAFSMGNLLKNEDVLIRRIDGFVEKMRSMCGDDNMKEGFDIVRAFNYVTFDIMGKRCDSAQVRKMRKADGI